MVSLCLATLATNIAANVVGPANDFAHLWPRRISFRTGGLITGVVGILIQPWKLIADPSGYIFKWLVAYSSLLGAVGGMLIADYYLIRRTRLDLKGLYRGDGPYWYAGGFNPAAMVALAVGIAPCVPGFLGTIGAMKVAPAWMTMYDYAWFISFGLSAVDLPRADEAGRTIVPRDERPCRAIRTCPSSRRGRGASRAGDSNQRVMVIFCWV